jgi:hypothetical protein
MIGSIILMVVYIAICFLAGNIAKKKNRSSVGWFIANLFFPIIAFIILCVLPKAYVGPTVETKNANTPVENTGAKLEAAQESELEASQILYISANGSDLNNGKTEEKPLKTIKRALALSEKTTKFIVLGTLTVESEGSKDAFAFTIKAKERRQNITITGKPDVTEKAVLSGKNCAGAVFIEIEDGIVTFENIEISGADLYGTEERYKLKDSNDLYEFYWKVTDVDLKKYIEKSKKRYTDDKDYSEGHVYAIHPTGIRIQSGSVEIGENVKITNNHGHGIYVSHQGVLTIKDGEITENHGSLAGGGVYCYGSFRMVGGLIANNSAQLGGGVGVGKFSSNTFKMTGGKIENNKAKKGGGLCVTDLDLFTIDGGAIDNNVSEEGDNNLATERMYSGQLNGIFFTA